MKLWFSGILYNPFYLSKKYKNLLMSDCIHFLTSHVIQKSGWLKLRVSNYLINICNAKKITLILTLDIPHSWTKTMWCVIQAGCWAFFNGVFFFDLKNFANLITGTAFQMGMNDNYSNDRKWKEESVKCCDFKLKLCTT